MPVDRLPNVTVAEILEWTRDPRAHVEDEVQGPYFRLLGDYLRDRRTGIIEPMTSFKYDRSYLYRSDYELIASWFSDLIEGEGTVDHYNNWASEFLAREHEIARKRILKIYNLITHYPFSEDAIQEAAFLLFLVREGDEDLETKNQEVLIQQKGPAHASKKKWTDEEKFGRKLYNHVIVCRDGNPTIVDWLYAAQVGRIYLRYCESHQRELVLNHAAIMDNGNNFWVLQDPHKDAYEILTRKRKSLKRRFDSL